VKGTIFNIKRYSIHDGPGIRTTVFLKGCPLNCVWCHNPEGIEPGASFFYDAKKCLKCMSCVRTCPEECISISEGAIKIELDRCTHCDACVKACPSNALTKNGVCYASDELMEMVKKDIPFFDESGGGVTFSGGEPMLQFDFLHEMLLKCKEQGIRTAVDTSGYASVEKFDKIRRLVDVFLYDIKFADEADHIQYTGVSNKLILKNLEFLLLQDATIWIRIPLIPGINDTQENINGTIRILKEIGFSGRVHLLAYHDLSTVKRQKIVEQANRKTKGAIFKNNRQLEPDMIKENFQSQGFEVKVGG
jgi:pyruvate formate lyase activating enzyme